MQALCFNVKSSDGDIRTRLERESYPALGDKFVVLDYPYVVRYVVDRFDPRDDVLPIDFIEPVTIVLRREAILEQSKLARKGVGLDLAKDLVARLEKTAELARTCITDKLTLEISHAEFVELCRRSGLRSLPDQFDLSLFRGIPMKVGEEGHEWNASTAFTGFNGDMCVLYVTFPGGEPMVMDAVLLDLTRKVASGDLTEDEAVAEVCLHIGAPAPVDPVLLHAVKNAISLTADGIFAAYDGAQDLVRITRPSQRASVDRVWQLFNEAETLFPPDGDRPFFRPI